MTAELLSWIQGRELVLGGLAVAVLALAVIARRISRAARPDEPLAVIAMLIGLGWSGEAMWVLATDILGVPWPVAALLLFVLEVQLVLAMLRARRHQLEHGYPGRYGMTVWIVAGTMSAVASAISESPAEFLLRLAIPLLVTKSWWDGLPSSGTVRRLSGAVTWRWTPRRLLLALGAIEPGERDVDQVHRERMIQQMTRLEFRRQGGSARLRGRRAARLSRLSLLADDEMIEEVRRRVGRASWFTVTPLTHLDAASDAAATHSLTQLLTQPPKRVTIQPTQGLTSEDAGDADAATRAADLWFAGKATSKREAARLAGADPTTTRRRIEEMTRAKINGHQITTS